MIEGLILSIQFLTRLPVRKSVDFNDENLSKSIFFYPFVGLIVGGIGGLFYYIFGYINESIGSFFSLLSMIVMTGGLHLDGLSDTCDGFLSYRDRDRVLEIMKDSRVGSFGVISIVLDILLKYILILSLEGNMFLILGLSCGNSRLTTAYLMSAKNAARKDGLGHMFHSSNPKKYALFGGIAYLLLVFLINPLYLVPLAFSFLAGQIIAGITYRKIGGFTGDVYGAAIELGEIVSLLVFLGVIMWI